MILSYNAADVVAASETCIAMSGAFDDYVGGKLTGDYRKCTLFDTFVQNSRRFPEKNVWWELRPEDVGREYWDTVRSMVEKGEMVINEKTGHYSVTDLACSKWMDYHASGIEHLEKDMVALKAMAGKAPK